MALSRWEPFGQTVPLRQLIDRLMEDAFIQPRSMPGGQEGTGVGMSGMGVALDLAEHENDFVVTVSLPGVRPEDLDLTVQDNLLTIQGEVRESRESPRPTAAMTPEQEDARANGQRGPQPSDEQGPAQGRRQPQYHYRERHVGRFKRQIALPMPVDADQAEAEFEYGVLTLRLPKAEQARRKRIAVRGQTPIEGQVRGSAKELKPGDPAATSTAARTRRA